MSYFLKFVEKIYVWILIFLLAMIGVSGSNVIHFAIEDYFNAALIKSYFFGYEYALSQSVLLICVLCYISLLGFQNYLKEKVNLFDVSYKKLFLFFALCFAVNIFVYITLVAYGYFSGRSDPGGLFRVLVTILFSVLALFFIYNRVSEKENFFTRYSRAIEIIVLLMLTGTTLFLTERFASPKQLQNLQKDFKTLKMLEDFSTAVEKFYSKNDELPKNKELLQSVGYLKRYNIDLDKVVYTEKDLNTFSVCSDFLTSSNDFTRISKLHNGNSIPFKKGKFCISYQMKSKKNPMNGKNEKVMVLVTTNVSVKD